MARFHIKKDGTPGQCHAQPGQCPLGGEGQHYPTMEAAQAAADAKHLESFTESNPSKQDVISQIEGTKTFGDWNGVEDGSMKVDGTEVSFITTINDKRMLVSTDYSEVRYDKDSEYNDEALLDQVDTSDGEGSDSDVWAESTFVGQVIDKKGNVTDESYLLQGDNNLEVSYSGDEIDDVTPTGKVDNLYLVSDRKFVDPDEPLEYDINNDSRAQKSADEAKIKADNDERAKRSAAQDAVIAKRAANPAKDNPQADFSASQSFTENVRNPRAHRGEYPAAKLTGTIGGRNYSINLKKDSYKIDNPELSSTTGVYGSRENIAQVPVMADELDNNGKPTGNKMPMNVSVNYIGYNKYGNSSNTVASDYDADGEPTTFTNIHENDPEAYKATTQTVTNINFPSWDGTIIDKNGVTHTREHWNE